jgi:hypothetical protein
MPREIARMRPVPGVIAAALAVLAVGLAGCGGSSASGSTASGSSAGGSSAGGSSAGGASRSSTSQNSPTGSVSQASSQGSSGGSSGGSLATSRLKVLTKLKKSQLCGALSPAQAARTLGAATAPPAYSHRLGLGATCEWIKKGAASVSDDELYIGISTIVDWTGAQAVDKLLHTSSVTIGGHPALAANKQARLDWAQVDVALGGDHDPVAEFRAPTMASALALAKAATPGLLAMG